MNTIVFLTIAPVRMALKWNGPDECVMCEVNSVSNDRRKTEVLKPKQAFLIIHQTLNNPSDFINVSPSLKAQDDLWKMFSLFHTRQWWVWQERLKPKHSPSATGSTHKKNLRACTHILKRWVWQPKLNHSDIDSFFRLYKVTAVCLFPKVIWKLKYINCRKSETWILLQRSLADSIVW